ncbi:hypothetical protein BJX61DRAFT_505463 [Aspergillus egyptiacus]|nr:hypothetical protein BJX61DRAFT_505463 [Aspergillus egyptiacus]
MKLEIAIFIGLFGAAIAAPTHSPQQKKGLIPWPFPFPGEGLEPEPEPTLPIPSGSPYPMSSAEATESGFPRLFPIHGAGRCEEEFPLDVLSEIGENIPLSPFDAEDEEDDESPLQRRVFPFHGLGGCGESPLDVLSELGENLPWSPFGTEDDKGQLQVSMEDESVIKMGGSDMS